MKIIDFHVHAFPDRIADRAVAGVEKNSSLRHAANGRLSGVRESMAEAEVCASVIMPVLTNPEKFEGANSFAAEINAERENILSFGAIHPLCTNIEDKLFYLKKAGFKGIKLHPDYQNIDIDSPEYMELIRAASDMGFVIMLHAGFDEAYAESTKAHPAKIRRMIDEVSPERLIVAHLGGYGYWDQSEAYLKDCDVYFDTAYCHTSGERFEPLIKSYGAERILFGSDSPWVNPKRLIDLIDSFELTAEEKDMIFYKNALSLLGTSIFASDD